MSRDWTRPCQNSPEDRQIERIRDGMQPAPGKPLFGGLAENTDVDLRAVFPAAPILGAQSDFPSLFIIGRVS